MYALMTHPSYPPEQPGRRVDTSAALADEPGDAWDPIQRSLSALLSMTTRALIDGRGLVERWVPVRFACMRGAIGSRPMGLRTRVFSGGAIARLTVAEMFEGTTARRVSCTISALPIRGTGLPILGLDYVALGGSLSLVAVDLSPTDPGVWHERARRLMGVIQHRARVELRARPRPAFVDDAFSPAAVFARADASQADVACALGVALIAHYAALCRDVTRLDSTRARGAEDATLRWCETMKRNKKEARALQHIFGPIATEYLETFLFQRDVQSA